MVPMGLSGQAKVRVEQGNELYRAAALMVPMLPDDVAWPIETDSILHVGDERNRAADILVLFPKVVGEDLTSCNFGGNGDKDTRLTTNTDKFTTMAGPCNRTHPPCHDDEMFAPWGLVDGRWAAHEEVEQPEEL